LYVNESNLTLDQSNISSSSAVLGGAVFLNSVIGIRIYRSNFTNNVANAFNLVSCLTISGAGGALYFRNTLNTVFVNLSASCVNNSAVWFGGAFGIDTDRLGLFKPCFFRNVSKNNFAEYGNFIGSLPAQLNLNIFKKEVLVGEQFVMLLTIADAFNQSVSFSYCGFRLLIESDSLQAQKLLKIEPSEFLFKDLSRVASVSVSTENDFVYEIRSAFSFGNAVPVFPNGEDIYNFSVRLQATLFENQIESSPIFLKVGLCSKGYVLEAHSVSFYSCVPCLSGAFANKSVDMPTQCSKCPLGRYSKELSLDCSACEEGRFSNNIGQGDFCNFCPTGTYSEGWGNSKCVSCDVGTFNSESGQRQCIACPYNSTTYQTNSNSIESCICPEGKYGNPTKDSCEICHEFQGIRCASNSSIPYVETGFWRSGDDPSLAYSCLPAFACSQTGLVH
jgi:hypothetical protein